MQPKLGKIEDRVLEYWNTEFLAIAQGKLETPEVLTKDCWKLPELSIYTTSN